MSGSRQMILAVIVWLAPVLALPFHLMAFIGAGMSAGVPSITFGEFALLGIAPLIAMLALLAILCFGKVTAWTVAALLIPALLSLAEFAFAFLLWKAG
jgi:hypothetical protein